MINSSHLIADKDLYIRFIQTSDIHRGWLNWINDPEVVKFLHTKPPVSEKDLIQFYHQNQLPNAALFAVCLLENDDYIGNVKIYNFNWDQKTAIFGRLLGNKKYHRMGYGKQMTRLILKFGFNCLNLEIISSGTNISHRSSIESNVKVGMRVCERDESKDLVRLEITRKEFFSIESEGNSHEK